MDKMITDLKKYCNEFDLVNRSIEYAKQFLCDFKKKNPKKFNEYFSRYNLHDMILTNFDRVNFEVLKIGYEIRPSQENQEILSVVMNMMTYDEDDNQDYQVCIYYCYFNLMGKFYYDYID